MREVRFGRDGVIEGLTGDPLGRFSEKTHKDVSRTIATTKIELFVALVSSFQPLTDFTENPNIGAMKYYGLQLF